MTGLWTAEAFSELEALWEGPATVKQIARVLTNRFKRRYTLHSVTLKGLRKIGRRTQPNDWPKALTERMIELWTVEGYSGSQCAVTLNEEFGTTLTRNAVVGKVHRLKIHRGGSPRVTQKRIYSKRGSYNPRVVQEPKPKREPKRIAPPIEVSHPLHLTIWESTATTCRYPFGERAPYSYCGHHVIPGQSWCPYHYGVTHTGEVATQQIFDRIAGRTMRTSHHLNAKAVLV